MNGTDTIKNSSTFIIAEAGVNHNGSLKLAKKMIDEAKNAGVNAIKFQTFKAERLVGKYASKADYQKKRTRGNESQFKMLKKIELTEESHYELAKYCKEKNFTFLSSPFDIQSIDFLDKLGLDTIKIPSGEITNLPYLRHLGALNKNIIISTGMADLGEIEDSLEILISSGTEKNKITVLHCNTEYPTPFEDVNLKAMITIKKAFKIKVGYSDHTKGIEVPIAAVALGAKVIEKHFTLDKNMEGPDHKSSLDIHELKLMVDSIRKIEKAIGHGMKKPSQSEIKNKSIVRKSIVAAKDIKKGEIFMENNITVKRPALGISPMYWDNIIGRIANKNFKKDEFITL